MQYLTATVTRVCLRKPLQVLQNGKSPPVSLLRAHYGVPRLKAIDPRVIAIIAQGLRSEYPTYGLV